MSLELDALVEAFETEVALDKSGYVMKVGSAPGKATKAEDDSAFILGFAYASTKNPITGIAEANKQVGIIKPRNGLVMRVPLTPNANRSTPIVWGSELVVDDVVDGTVCEVTDSGKLRVGYAREACAATADTEDGMIEVEVQIGGIIEVVV
jgi:hypothetical protein